MAEGKGREGYYDPFAGIAGAAPARSALTLRIVLASLGLVVCAAGAVVLWIADASPAYPAIATFFAPVGLVDVVVVVRRKLRGEPG